MALRSVKLTTSISLTQYSLERPLAVLTRELDAYVNYRMQALNATRTSNAATTAARSLFEQVATNNISPLSLVGKSQD